jgi:16S rRNA (guanine966-N2)-methyltransferase
LWTDVAKDFFFEKKKQKTFGHWASASPERLGPGFRSFLVLFFKKERLPLRIVAGTWRGKRLVAPAGDATRPTAERARQALFDMLAHASWGGRDLLEGARVLDAFAGTGALGLEALSRGAAEATFMENSRAALAALGANVAACNAGARARILAVDATHPPKGGPCQIIFLDPPYDHDLLNLSLHALRESGWMVTGTIIVAEARRSTQCESPGTLLDERSYGTAKIMVWRGD